MKMTCLEDSLLQVTLVHVEWTKLTSSKGAMSMTMSAALKWEPWLFNWREALASFWDEGGS